MTDKLKCPKCGGGNIKKDDCYDIVDTMRNNVRGIKELLCGHCLDCGANLQWSKIYQLVGYDEMEVD